MRRLAIQFVWIAMLSVATLTAIPPGSAVASQARIAPCLVQDQTTDAIDWASVAGGYPTWILTGRCSVRLSSHFGTNPPSLEARFEYPGIALEDSVFEKVSFNIAGGDGSDGGLRQVVKICDSEGDCGPSISPPSANEVVPTHHELTASDGDFPTSANRIVLEGKCVSWPACSTARPLEIDSIEIITSDEFEPTLEWDDFYNNGLNDVDLKSDRWLRSPTHAPLIARDRGTGVSLIDIHYNTYYWNAKWTPGCGVEYSTDASAFCPSTLWTTDVVPIGPSLHFRNLNQGLNNFHAVAYDVAGNASDPIEVEFKIDTHLPRLAWLKADTNGPKGWQSKKAVTLSWQNTGETHETATQSGIASATYDVEPYAGIGEDPAPQTVEGENISELELFLPGSGMWRINMFTTDQAGNRSLSEHILVGVDSTVLDAPTVAPVPTLSSQDLTDGFRVAWSEPANANEAVSGVCGYSYKVDQSPSADPGVFAMISPTDRSLELPSVLANGTNYLHLRAITCAGAPGQITDYSFEVDAAAPIVEFSSAGPGGWYSDSFPFFAYVIGEPEGTVRMSAVVDGIPVAEVWDDELRFALDENDHSVTVYAFDGLGNVAAKHREVKTDRSAPAGHVLSADPADPARVRAVLHDESSGMRDAYLQYRRSAGGSWQTMGQIVRPVGGSSKSLAVDAVIPDHLLEAGIYDLRVVASDLIGNVAAIRSRLGGSPAAILLPARDRPQISAGFRTVIKAKKCKSKKKRKCKSTPRRVTFPNSKLAAGGRSALIEGTLLSKTGAPLSGARIDVVESVVGLPRRVVSNLVVGPSGKFRFRPRPGPSRRVTFNSTGSPTQLPVEREVTLLSRPKISLRLSKRVIRTGRLTKITGRISAPEATYPRTGKPISFQYRTRGRWRPLGLRATADASGRFRASYRGRKTGRAISFRIRAVVPGAEGWAYETGYSRSSKLVVRP